MKHRLFWEPLSQVLFICLLIVFSAHSHAAESLAIKPHEQPDTCNPNVPQIRVTINGVGSGGVLNVELYDNPDYFLFKKGRVLKIRVPALETQQKVCMDLTQPGTYAVAVYQDLDSNRKLKKQWNQLPLEPFGLSNNPEQHFGFPRFRDSAFTTGRLGADIAIDLKQPPDP
ncbi:MAG: DUF2141 domain-containing protein [Nitrosomonas sp.]|nr:DUF2141 domain-containing protein [Nitrosomonas sp.]